MKWPWQKRTEARSFTDLVTAGLWQSAQSGPVDASRLAVSRACADLWAGAFAAAEVTGSDLVTPDVLSKAGLDLVLRGQSVWALVVSNDGPALLRAADYEVHGALHDYHYRLTVPQPDGDLAYRKEAPDVAHLAWHRGDAHWDTTGPMQTADAQLLARLSVMLDREVQAPHGRLLPLPTGSGDMAKFRQLAQDLRTNDGGIQIVESTSSAFSEGRAARPSQDWAQRRYGFEATAELNELRRDLIISVARACGVPVDLLDRDAPGTAAREAMRRFQMLSVAPKLRLVLAEFSRVLDAGLTADLDSLYGHDLVGRASAFASLRQGGLRREEALDITGLLP